MSLAKLKKAELVALAEANDLIVDPDWNKDELIDELDSAGIEAETADSAKNSESIHTDGKRITKAMRQKRLFARTDHKPGEAMLFRSKKERQKDLQARTDRTA